MLRHKALIQGVRVAFGLSGIQDEEEAELATMSVAKVVSVVDAPKVRRLVAPVKEAAPVEQTQEAAPEPETTLQPEEEAPDATVRPLVIPEDPAELLDLARQVLAEFDIEDADALRCLKALKKCGAACKALSDVARAGHVWLCERPADVVEWVNANRE
jgi:hypothetical protein